MQPTKREKFLLTRIRIFKDEHAFESLLNEYSPALQRFLYSKLPGHNDVEDAYSALMLRLWEYTIRTPVEHFSGLAYTVARGIIAEFYRKREGKEYVQISDAEGEEGVEVESEYSAQYVETQVDSQLVKDAIKKLQNEDDREVILLRFVEGYRVKDIATYLGKTENAVSVIIHRALKKIRKNILKKE
ncbi:sigma-70 family RNA polymerase sigma factor [Candidatus Uhrbacteria bacterium]|nr:sigma-70 family RNA polymerase sigma factor [Candidatus Uhrbacteria bacterium]